MKNLKIQIQIIVLTICIAVTVSISGYLAYQSLSGIIDTIHKEARPDLKLLLIKDIASDLNQVENNIRLYSLSGNASFLKSYRQLGDSIQEKIRQLSEYSDPGSPEINHLDSIALLASQKLLVWDKIRALHRTKNNAHESFSNLYSKIDTTFIQPDTIRFKPEEKKSFLKRLFGKKDTTTKRPIIIDKSGEKEIIKKEIAGIEKQIVTQTKQLQTKEASLFGQNIQITQQLNNHIRLLENSEQQRLMVKTREADLMARQTYQRMAFFTIAAVLFLFLILILFFQNLRKSRAYQQVLKKAKAEAESLAKAKETFVATVSHEMRTPVNAIYGLTSQMLRKDNPPGMTSDLEVVHQSASHLMALVNDTLDFSKIESQKMNIEQIDFLPDEIFKEVFTLHTYSAHEKGLELVVRNNADEKMVLKGDPIRLKQILINLISNAIKFTNQGKITLTSSVEEKEEQYMLHLEVSDTGIGISKEDLPKIFDEFVQVGNDLTQKQRGAGLGLAIVKKLILLQDGNIETESTVGRGTRFKIQIPYRKGNPDHAVNKDEEPFAVPGWFRKLHVLVVDDEEFNLYLIKNILGNWEIAFSEAHNGLEACELAAKNSFDAILMDIRMPVMDGFEAAKQILRRDPSSRIIALTATTRPEDIQKIGQAGMIAFLPKPFPERDLRETFLKFIPEKTSDPELKLSEKPHINLEELTRLTGGDVAFRNEMIRIFIRSGEEALDKFRVDLQNLNRPGLAETAHKLAAPAKHMMASELYRKLKELENQSETFDPDELNMRIAEIEKILISVSTFLKQELDPR